MVKYKVEDWPEGAENKEDNIAIINILLGFIIGLILLILFALKVWF